MTNPLTAIQNRDAARINISVTREDKQKLEKLTEMVGVKKPTTLAYALFKNSLDIQYAEYSKKAEAQSTKNK